MNQKILLFLLGITTIAFSQNDHESKKASNDGKKDTEIIRVEKSIYGIQTGISGVWIHNESRITDQIALRSEIGLDYGAYGGIFREDNDFLIPVITVEPRWYYNLEKRSNKGKNIAKNSGNFLSLKTKFYPDLFVISKNDDLEVPNQLSIIPTWGIKRTYGNFTFETGAGIGMNFFLEKTGPQFNYDYFNDDELFLNLTLRIGYTF